MHAIEKFIDAMTRSWWLTAAVFVWLGLFWFPLLDQLASLMDRLRGQCVQCGRLRSIHVDATMRYRDFCDEIGLTPEEVARREMPMHAFWAKTALDLEKHERTHDRNP
jgi:hypothetical protein